MNTNELIFPPHIAFMIHHNPEAKKYISLLYFLSLTLYFSMRLHLFVSLSLGIESKYNKVSKIKIKE
jgi:hypothetical protein